MQLGQLCADLCPNFKVNVSKAKEYEEQTKIAEIMCFFYIYDHH